MSQKKRSSTLPKSIITLKIPNENILYQSYLSFLKHGGLFIKTKRAYQLGKEVFLLLTLDKETNPIVGKVVWINPQGAQGGRPPGIGVHFNAMDEGKTRKKIEQLLVGKLKQEQRTYTI
jgi:type IV pilus assembly protein PilZ